MPESIASAAWNAIASVGFAISVPLVYRYAMSPSHFGLYLVLGIALVGLGLWRFSDSRSVSGLRHGGLLLGAAILTILAASLLGIVSLEGVEQCLNETRSRRSKHVVCLFHVRWASP